MSLAAVAICALASGPAQAHGCITRLQDGRVVVTPALVGGSGLTCPTLLLLPGGTVTTGTIRPSATGRPSPFTTGNIAPFTTGNIGPFTTNIGRFTTGGLAPFTTESAPATVGSQAPFTTGPSDRGMVRARR